MPGCRHYCGGMRTSKYVAVQSEKGFQNSLYFSQKKRTLKLYLSQKMAMDFNKYCSSVKKMTPTCIVTLFQSENGLQNKLYFSQEDDFKIYCISTRKRISKYNLHFSQESVFKIYRISLRQWSSKYCISVRKHS